MNNKIKYLMSAVACLLMTACEKELPTFHDYNSYTFNGEDVNGGSWKTTLISSPSDVVIPDPSGSQSAEYLGEISNLKNAQATMSSHDRDQINYWTSNPEIRWNEIALELIAKYNLIPGPNDERILFPMLQILQDLHRSHLHILHMQVEHSHTYPLLSSMV